MSIGGRTWPSTETSGDRSKRDLKSVDIDVDRWEDRSSTETSGDRSKRDLKSVDIDVDRWVDLVID